MRVGSLASHIGLLDDKFQYFLASGKLGKVCSWYNNMGLHVQIYRYSEITWIILDKACDPFQ